MDINKNLSNIKLRLTIFFTIIVFFIILILWFIYFSFKYFKEYSFESKSLYLFNESIVNWSFNYFDLTDLSDDFDKRFEEEKKLNNKKNKPPKVNNEYIVNFIILDSNNSIIKSDIKWYFDETLILNILDNININKIFYTDNKIFLLSNIDNWKNILSFKYIKYDFLEYLEDLFLYFLLSFFISILIYYIWFYFIKKVFIPVEQNIDEMNDFIHNASHELKTPISVIDSNIQLMLDSWNIDKSMILEIQDENSKISKLIDWLIKLSDISYSSSKSNINILEITNNIIKDNQKLIEDKKIVINYNASNELIYKWNYSHIYILLSNIIQNSIKYSHLNWKIDIFIKNNTLSIKDYWVWIDKNNLDKIFKRFYKEDYSRSTPWFWIWLSLVKKISSLYNIWLKVESEKNKYTIFTISF